MSSGFVVFLITAAFVMLTYIGYLVVEAMVLRRSRIRRRVAELAGAPTRQESKLERAKSMGDSFPTISRLITSQGFADGLLISLNRAGIKLRPSEFVGIVSGATILLAMLASIIIKTFAALILAVLLGVAVPVLYIKMLQAKRTTIFNRQLPDALSLVSSAIRSGYGLSRAMQLVADEMPAPISEEFRRVLNETNVGLSMDVALTRMVQRVGSYDVDLVVTAMIIQQQVGGNLAEVIDNIAATIRDRIRVEGEVSALTAEGRISGIILVALPILLAVFVGTTNPSYLQPLITEPIGIWMVIGGICLQILGGLIIKRMLVLDY